MIRNVVHRKTDPALTNVRPQRELIGVFNGDADLQGYQAEQIKIIQLTQNDYLGKTGHYHNYAELYYVMVGEVTFDVWDRAGSDAKERYSLETGDILLIPAGVAHRAYAKNGTVMLGSSSKPYTFQPQSDIPADFEPMGGLPYGLE